MKKILCFALFVSFFSFAVNAKVTFLPGSAGSVGPAKKSTSITTGEKCQNAGYRKTSCSKGQYGVDVCPYNNKYYKTCCPNEYMFTKHECVKQGLSFSQKTCGGKHMCM